MKYQWFKVVMSLFSLIPCTAFGQVWKGISAGVHYSMAVKEDGTLWSCGLNDTHQLGRNSQPEGNIYQTGTSTEWESVSASYGYTAGIKKDHTLWVWGWEDAIGLDNLGDLTKPVQIDTQHNWQKVVVSFFTTLAIKTDSTLWAWGNNDYGTIGDGTILSRKFPVNIGNGAKWKDLKAGGSVLAIKNDGTLWAWGRNDWGQLGDGTFLGRTAPVQVGTSNDWKSISVGNAFSLAIKNNGTLWAWGFNGYHQLGDGTSMFSNVPIQITASEDWECVVASDGYSLAIKTDGSLWAWGDNEYHQLGNGTNTGLNIPTQVGNGHDWKEISANPDGQHVLGLKEDGSLWGWGDSTSNSMGCLFDFSVPVELNCVVSSVNDLLPEAQVDIYPNPANEFINIELKGAREYRYEIRNPVGILISTDRIKDLTEAIDISTLAKGLYFITIKTEKGQTTRPFVKM